MDCKRQIGPMEKPFDFEQKEQEIFSTNNPNEDPPFWNVAIFFSESEKLKISTGAPFVPLFNTMLMLSSGIP
jgi:hypothetical protein